MKKDFEDKTYEELRDECELLQGLQLHPGFSILCDYAEFDARNALDAFISSPLSSSEQVYAQEFIKGRAMEARAFRFRAESMIDILKAEIAKRTAEKDAENENDASPTP
jgi:hypothetical protein